MKNYQKVTVAIFGMFTASAACADPVSLIAIVAAEFFPAYAGAILFAGSIASPAIGGCSMKRRAK